jgi:hypothetical protein
LPGQPERRSSGSGTEEIVHLAAACQDRRVGQEQHTIAAKDLPHGNGKT